MNALHRESSEQSETEALRRALTLLGFDPDRMIQFLQKKDRTPIEKHVFAAMDIVFRPEHVVKCGGTEEEAMQIKAIIDTLRTMRDIQVPWLGK